MTKYQNNPLYFYGNRCYFQTKRDDSVAYVSTDGRELQDLEKDKSLFFSSTLEFQTYKYLAYWIKGRADNPDYDIKLIQQFPLVLLPANNCFPEYRHKVDFAIAVKTKGTRDTRLYLIEAKGIITKDSMLILRLLESQYEAISKQKYLMVFGRYPDKFPRSFPKETLKTVPLNLDKTLDKFINLIPPQK